MNHTSTAVHNDFEELIPLLRAEGHEEAAERLNVLLHEIAWTSALELTGELGLEIVRFHRTHPRMSPELHGLLRRCLDVVKQVWPNIEKASAT